MKEATAKGEYKDDQKTIGGEWKFQARPEFLARRQEFFGKLFDKQKEFLATCPQ